MTDSTHTAFAVLRSLSVDDDVIARRGDMEKPDVQRLLNVADVGTSVQEHRHMGSTLGNNLSD